MITIPEIVEESIKNTPFLEEAIASNLVNLSSLARQIKPVIQQALDQKSLRDRPVTTGAIVMALKRLKDKLTQKTTPIKQILSGITDISVKSSLTEYTFSNSPTLINKQAKLLQVVLKEQNVFLTMTDGIYETSLFISSSKESTVDIIFQDERLKRKLSGLSSVTIILPEEITYVPGVYYSILKALAWEGISFVEVLSSFTELTIFIEEARVDKAFSALKKLAQNKIS